VHDWLRRLPPNVQGALWLVAGAHLHLDQRDDPPAVDADRKRADRFFRAVISVILLLP